MAEGISVIVPVYNSEKFISECILSILSQDYNRNIEIVISDDGSTDKSLEVAESYGDKIIIVKKPNDCKTKGASGARNRGIEKAALDYICFLDSDDYYLPSHLRIMAETLDNNKELGYAFCRSMKEYTDSNGCKVITNWTRARMSELDRDYHVLYRSNCINTNVIIVKREVFEKIGVFNTCLSNGEDSEMWIRISEHYKHKFVNNNGAVYRIGHGISQLTANSILQKKKCSEIINAEAFARNYINPNCEKMRMFLIIRALIYEKLKLRNSKIGVIYTHMIVMNKLFHISPSVFFKFLIRI
ncbi:MAG: glycosyltransferase [Flavobacterium sp.]|nr:glycosyltransferase [Flavobacterium sp.]